MYHGHLNIVMWPMIDLLNVREPIKESIFFSYKSATVLNYFKNILVSSKYVLRVPCSTKSQSYGNLNHWLSNVTFLVLPIIFDNYGGLLIASYIYNKILAQVSSDL